MLRSFDDTLPVTVHDGRLDPPARNAAAADLFGPVTDDGRYGRDIVRTPTHTLRHHPARPRTPPPRPNSKTHFPVGHRGEDQSPQRLGRHCHVGHPSRLDAQERAGAGEDQPAPAVGARMPPHEGGRLDLHDQVIHFSAPDGGSVTRDGSRAPAQHPCGRRVLTSSRLRRPTVRQPRRTSPHREDLTRRVLLSQTQSSPPQPSAPGRPASNPGKPHGSPMAYFPRVLLFHAKASLIRTCHRHEHHPISKNRFG